ncbi:MAG TPA: hypothetical protein VLM42_19155 [Bryobacteraceae bacterium]|nr:hypothetical protein [Bryobacteraceae bacterium]
MFHWICPECGREIAPTVRECPACDPAAATVENALAGEVEAPARALDQAPASIAANTPPTNPSTEPRLEGADSVRLPQRAGSDVPPALAAPVEAMSPPAARNSKRVAEVESLDTLPQFGAPDGGRHPLDQFSAMLDSMEPEPPASRQTLPMPMRALPRVPASLRAFIAELQPAGTRPNAPLPPLQRVRAAFEPPLLTSPTRLPLKSHPPQASRPLGAKLLALPTTPTPAPQPYALDLAPPLAPLGHYSPLAGRPLQPAPPETQVLKRECAPRTTLPGPMLTRRLVKFEDRELSAIPPGLLRVKKRLIPGWMASALIIGTLLGAGFTSVMSFVRPAAEGKQVAVAEAAAPAPAAPVVRTASAASPSSPIEVTGFRIQIDPAKKPEIQYLVVNHSPLRFTGVNVNVTLYAADAKAGQPALCSFQFAAPNLGPFQSKDMTSAIDPETRPVSVPDWQDLRASVEIVPAN